MSADTILEAALAGGREFREAEVRALGPVDLVEWEELPPSWWETLRATEKCPDCGRGDLREGPSGGACVNVRCDFCLAKFNLGPFGAFGQRLEAGWVSRLPPIKEPVSLALPEAEPSRFRRALRRLVAWFRSLS